MPSPRRRSRFFSAMGAPLEQDPHGVGGEHDPDIESANAIARNIENGFFTYFPPIANAHCTITPILYED